MKRGTLLVLENVNIYQKDEKTGFFLYYKKIRNMCSGLLMDDVTENTIFVKVFIAGKMFYIDWWRTQQKQEVQRVHALRNK